MGIPLTHGHILLYGYKDSLGCSSQQQPLLFGRLRAFFFTRSFVGVSCLGHQVYRALNLGSTSGGMCLVPQIGSILVLLNRRFCNMIYNPKGTIVLRTTHAYIHIHIHIHISVKRMLSLLIRSGLPCPES